MKYISNKSIDFIFSMGIVLLSTLGLYAAPQNDELVQLHTATTAQMNAITSPATGSLIFNTDDKNIYEYNSTAWHKLSNDGSETKVAATNCIEVTGTGTTADPYIIKDKNLGETQATAGITCKDILDNGCNVRDGIYWIDPNGGSKSDAFEVYCDMTGGGWTRIDYTEDLEDKSYFSGGDAWRWLSQNFTFALTDTQINDIRAVSTEGKQTYVGQCDGVITYYYDRGSTYNYAFGFRFHTGYETVSGQQNYTDTSITVLQDGCKTNDSKSLNTVFEINDIRLPIINVRSRDNGNSSETFGSPLKSNPAWFR
jgi:hypothetical protein